MLCQYLRWFENFYSDRTHCTRVEEFLSDVAESSSGVVQGSGIGPLMFLILTYVNELIGILEEHNIKTKMICGRRKTYVNIVNDA